MSTTGSFFRKEKKKRKAVPLTTLSPLESAQVPSSRLLCSPDPGGGSAGPSAAGQGLAQNLTRGLFGATHTVGFLSNWLPGKGDE